jgi:hypothetical protein
MVAVVVGVLERLVVAEVVGQVSDFLLLYWKTFCADWTVFVLDQ